MILTDAFWTAIPNMAIFLQVDRDCSDKNGQMRHGRGTCHFFGFSITYSYVLLTLMVSSTVHPEIFAHSVKTYLRTKNFATRV